MSTETILTIILCVMSVLLFVFTIILVRQDSTMNQLKNELSSLKYLIHKLQIQHESDTNTFDEITECCNDIQTRNKTYEQALTSLTSSIRSILKQNIAKQSATTYPTSQMMPEIDAFITEHILMAAYLISNQNIPDNPIYYILEAAVKAYPNIDRQYLSERINYIANQFNNSSTGKKAE